jgi:hypothetical protein
MMLLIKGVLLLGAQLVTFSDVSQSTGINASHQLDFNNPTYGIGQAFIDLDNDGDQDLLLTNQDGSNYVYINSGSAFNLTSAYPELAMTDDVVRGVTVADYDNDGWDDLFFAMQGTNRLMRNQSGSSFADVTAQAGFSKAHDSINAAWADLNQDGWLDLMVINYDDLSAPLAYDELYLSNGDGTFTDITTDLLAAQISKPALAVTFLDYDNDGDQDIYVVNDKLVGNTLWKNQGPAQPGCGVHWCLEDVSVQTNTNRAVYGMGIAVGDYDLDGDYDLYFSSIAEQVFLESQVANGNEAFIDRSDAVGLNFFAVGWATLLLDVDNDGYQDAFLATDGSTAQSNDRLYLNNTMGGFTDVSASSGLNDLVKTRGAASGDFNQDGLLDVVFGNWGVDFRLYQNNTSNSNQWIKWQLSGSGTVNRNAIGSSVKMSLSDGRQLMRYVYSGASFGAGNERTLHFGVGQATIEQVYISWANGAGHLITSWQMNQPNQISYQESLFSGGFD